MRSPYKLQVTPRFAILPGNLLNTAYPLKIGVLVSSPVTIAITFVRKSSTLRDVCVGAPVVTKLVRLCWVLSGRVTACFGTLLPSSMLYLSNICALVREIIRAVCGKGKQLLVALTRFPRKEVPPQLPGGC